MTASAKGAMPASQSARVSSLSSAFVPYLVSRSYRRCGRYPSGDTECDGGGSHTALTPNERITAIFLRHSSYQDQSASGETSRNEHERQWNPWSMMAP